MESQVATSLLGLEAELHRLEAMAANATGAEAAAMRNAASLISDAITILVATKSAVAAPSATLEPTQPRIADRIVMIAPHDGAETFRTKVKLKTPEPSAIAAPVVASLVAADDLTRIRSIDATLAGRLAAHGVTSFAAIAAWSHPDVRRISDALGLNREISRQNWIEQAALLSGSKALAAQQLVPEPMVVADPATPSPPDRLDLIAGIDIGMAETLKAFGITRWAEIAAWRRDDIELFGAQVAKPVSIMRQGWIEQAALLASGRLSHHAMRVQRGDFAAVVAQPVAEPLPDPVFLIWPVPTVHEIAALEVSVMPHMANVASIVADDSEAQFTLPAALLTAFAPSTKTAPEVELVTTAPTVVDPSIAATLDRVTALEHELAAQIANDVSWSHVTTPPSRVSRLHIEDEEFPELHVSEADVKIVRRSPVQPTTTPRADNAATRSLLARLKRSSPLNDIDRSTYAGYRDHVEEASVVIVKASAKGEKAAPPPANPAAPAPGQSSLQRLLRPFTGDASN